LGLIMNIWAISLIICWNGCILKGHETVLFMQTYSCDNVSPTVYKHKDYSFKIHGEYCQLIRKNKWQKHRGQWRDNSTFNPWAIFGLVGDLGLSCRAKLINSRCNSCLLSLKIPY
jgi:hypothetical protein